MTENIPNSANIQLLKITQFFQITPKKKILPVSHLEEISMALSIFMIYLSSEKLCNFSPFIGIINFPKWNGKALSLSRIVFKLI